MNVSKILENFREMSPSKREQGKLFEKFCREWLRLSPEYRDVKDVWLWGDWKYRTGADIGIDLVAETFAGEFWGIQCKFYAEGSVDKGDVDSFLATGSGKDFGGIKFSRLLLFTTTSLTKNAMEAIEDRTPPVTLVRVDHWDDVAIDWDRFWSEFDKKIVSGGDSDARIGAEVLRPKKELRDHQKAALEAVRKGFQTADRGKLVMACGTGKTLTSLRIAEAIVPENGICLYLVPSLTLLAQGLKEWSRDANRSFAPILVCSDAQIHERDSRRFAALSKSTKKKGKQATEEDESTFASVELATPATTKPEVVLSNFERVKELPKDSLSALSNVQRPTGAGSLPNRAEARTKPALGRFCVVFSTYQSLDVVSKAQEKGLPEFDLVICDEAHRTTGVALSSEDESSFTKIHRNENIRAKRRLYMTATPKVYGEFAKAKAKAASDDAILCSMDDEKLFGREFYRLSFGSAVEQGLLSDYKVLILTADERDAKVRFDRLTALRSGKGEAKSDYELDVSEVGKLIGCWRGLEKRGRSYEVDGAPCDDFAYDPEPMRRAVAFCASIKMSKAVVRTIGELDEIADEDDRTDPEGKQSFKLRLDAEHIDGTDASDKREDLLAWLKDAPEPGKCRVLSNVRCLSEGVDVPTLDAAIFLSPRNSQVDVIQAVGRVMRKAEGKKYGYIILPIVVPPQVSAEEALNDNERYKVVWQTLQAIRSHDERFHIMINQIQVGEKPSAIDIVPVAPGPGDPDAKVDLKPEKAEQTAYIPGIFDTAQNYAEYDKFKDAIYAQVVKKCGEREYLDQWATEVGRETSTRIDLIRERLANPNPEQRRAFERLVSVLRAEVNPNVDEARTIEFLSQHLTTLPVFDALFPDRALAETNPVAKQMEETILAFQIERTPEERAKELEFKKAISRKIEGISSAHGRQMVIHKLYEQFFKIALPKTAEKLGVVYTPVEVVDYILRSVDYVLRKEFNRRLTNPSVHVLDPFAGTGTFIARLIETGLIEKKDLKRKYRESLHCNEIMLLAYYIAAVNIEETYYAQLTPEERVREGRVPFPGIVLTDTFQSTERDLPEQAQKTLTGELVNASNHERLNTQRRQVIRVVVGNPPYSVGQKSGNDNNQNDKYPKLEQRIAETYAAKSTAQLKNSLYDSYIKAFRWASDRVDPCKSYISEFIGGGGATPIIRFAVELSRSFRTAPLSTTRRWKGSVSRYWRSSPIFTSLTCEGTRERPANCAAKKRTTSLARERERRWRSPC